MSKTLEHLKRLEQENQCYKQIIKELSGYSVIGVGIDIENPDPFADQKAFDALISQNENLENQLSQVAYQCYELLEALEEVIAISDRKHDAWDRAKAAITKAKGENE